MKHHKKHHHKKHHQKHGHNKVAKMTQNLHQHKHHKKHHHKQSNEMNLQIDYLMAQHNQFKFHKNLVQMKKDGDDINNDIGTLPGQTNRNYAHVRVQDWDAMNHIMSGSHITVPRDEGAQPMRNSAIMLNKYSDELANGDSADDREIHEDEDMNDDVVDVNGQTNRGYGSRVPVDYFAGNHIMAGSHITIPRDEGAQPMRNSLVQMRNEKYSDELANGDSADDREIHEEEDMNDDVVDFNGQTNRGYGSAVPRVFFAGNHIMEGSHIQVPRDEGPQPLRNNAAI